MSKSGVEYLAQHPGWKTVKSTEPRMYRGVWLTPIKRTIAGLTWGAYTGDRFVYADTLEGIKELVRRVLAGKEV